MAYSNIPVDTIYKGITDMQSEAESFGVEDIEDFVNFDILQAIAFNTLGEEDYRQSETPVSDVFEDTGMKLCMIERDSVLGWCLQRYIGEPAIGHMDTVSEKWAETLRGFYLANDNKYIYFVHGVGYDWIDSDLLGGNGDGSKRKAFEDGVAIVANFEKRES